jgi:hypothetical protein
MITIKFDTEVFYKFLGIFQFWLKPAKITDVLHEKLHAFICVFQI